MIFPTLPVCFSPHCIVLHRSQGGKSFCLPTESNWSCSSTTWQHTQLSSATKERQKGLLKSNISPQSSHLKDEKMYFYPFFVYNFGFSKMQGEEGEVTFTKFLQSFCLKLKIGPYWRSTSEIVEEMRNVRWLQAVRSDHTLANLLFSAERGRRASSKLARSWQKSHWYSTPMTTPARQIPHKYSPS